MGQLVMFLIYLAIIAAFIWQIALLARDPSSRTLPRILFVLAAGAILAVIVYAGILH
jgi:hypothetical protein